MEYNYGDELYHWGKKGMKWGVRRYQNKDGTLTDAGKKRYARDAREKEFNKYDEQTGQYYKQSKKNGRTDLDVDATRYVTEDIQRTKRLTDASAQMTRELQNVNSKATKRDLQKNKMDLSEMSDKEMRDQINRAILERQYNDMFNPVNEKRGRERASEILETAGSVLMVTSSALGIALAIKELTGK